MEPGETNSVPVIKDPTAAAEWTDLCAVLEAELVVQDLGQNGYAVTDQHELDGVRGCAITLSLNSHAQMQVNLFFEDYGSEKEAGEAFRRKTDIEAATEAGLSSAYALDLPHESISDSSVSSEWEQGIIRAGVDGQEYDEVVAVAQYEVVVLTSIIRFISEPDRYCPGEVGVPTDGECEIGAEQMQRWIENTYLKAALGAILAAYNASDE